MNNECQALSQTGNNEPQIGGRFSSGRPPSSTSTTTTAKRATIPRFIGKNASLSIVGKYNSTSRHPPRANSSPLCRQCYSGVDPCRVAPCCGLIAAPKTTRREKEALHGCSITFVFSVRKETSTKKPETVIFVAPRSQRRIRFSDDSINTPPIPSISNSSLLVLSRPYQRNFTSYSSCC